jgi:heme/copper-type cytochrome/quinol oxidase subunit 3
VSTESLVNKVAPSIEDPEDFGRRWMAGAALLIVADASFVAALSFTYLYLRAVDTEHAFHPAGSPTASLYWPWLVTACMVVGFAAYLHGMRRDVDSAESTFVTSAGAGIVVMAIALVLNIIQIATFPFSVSDNAYSSAVFVIAAGNVFHLLLTLFVGIGAVNRSRRGLTHGPQGWQLRIVGMWWLWVCVAAAIGALTVTVANGTVG